MISNYVPNQEFDLARNPNFKQWTPNTPDGHLDGIHIKIGVTPEQAVNMTADGELDWYFEPIAPDRLHPAQGAVSRPGARLLAQQRDVLRR